MKSLIQLKALRFWIHFATASVVFTFALAFAPAKAETLFLQKDMTARQLGLDDEDLFPFRSIILTFDRGYCSFVGNVMTKKVFAAGVYSGSCRDI